MMPKDLIIGLERMMRSGGAPTTLFSSAAMEKLFTKFGTVWRHKAGMKARTPEPR